MSVITKRLKDGVEECWYDSSNVLHTSCVDKDDDYKDVTAVFKGGRTYLYRAVDVKDYVAFRDSESQGKALRRFLDVDEGGKKRYQVARLSDTDLGGLEKRRAEAEEENRKDAEREKEREQEEADAPARYVFLEDNDAVRLYKDGRLLASAETMSGITAAMLLGAEGRKFEVKSIRNKDANPTNGLI